MTPRISIVLLLSLALPSVAAERTHTALEGAWQLQSGEYVGEDGVAVDYASLQLAGTKLLADGHFAFTTTSRGRFWAGGSGTYASDAATYTETPRMASYPLEGDGRYSFRYTLQGDTWTLERWDGDRRVEREVWRRALAEPRQAAGDTEPPRPASGG
ncbi:hypothetical protein OK348_12820 [Flavobacterium sp. MXW15]|uniref:Lipocalin-like domain-containing protein n=1 Tax=Xanthomonas chitinilytica TaxID=2989819 RepID=A0ABT3JWI8_9XANT|nr:hypothetical protein [Xanthomonas sp. H13-6]MCW4455668.1 hypothetical protein [Flavobacterium sp. MXW15]MCW4472846.1 hypothetical protein [Xanthomonas sp. H13-6]